MRPVGMAGVKDTPQLVCSERVFGWTRGRPEVDAVTRVIGSDSLRDQPAEVVLDCGEAPDEGGLPAVGSIPLAPYQDVGLCRAVGT